MYYSLLRGTMVMHTLHGSASAGPIAHSISILGAIIGVRLKSHGSTCCRLHEYAPKPDAVNETFECGVVRENCQMFIAWCSGVYQVTGASPPPPPAVQQPQDPPSRPPAQVLTNTGMLVEIFTRSFEWSPQRTHDS
eukprot:778493-Amphidinium_carterae.1